MTGRTGVPRLIGMRLEFPRGTLTFSRVRGVVCTGPCGRMSFAHAPQFARVGLDPKAAAKGAGICGASILSDTQPPHLQDRLRDVLGLKQHRRRRIAELDHEQAPRIDYRTFIKGMNVGEFFE